MSNPTPKEHVAAVRFIRKSNTYAGPIDFGEEGGEYFVKDDTATVAHWREAERVAREGVNDLRPDLKYAAKLRKMIDRCKALGIVADDAKFWPEIQSAEMATR